MNADDDEIVGASGAEPPARHRPTAAELISELPVFVAAAMTATPAEFDVGDQEDVDALVELGLARDDAEESVRRGHVPLALVRQALGEDRSIAIAAAAAATGVPEDVLVRVRAALGLAPTDTFGATDVAWAEGVAQLLELVSIDGLVRAGRGRGQALTTLAMNDLSVIRDELMLPMRAAGADDLTIAIALSEAVKALLPIASDLLVHTYKLQLEQLLGSELAALAATSDQAEVDLAVGFVDVVGYTALSARIDPSGLDEILDAFEDHVLNVIVAHDEVAVVKYLGDAAMLVAPTPEHLAMAMIDLVAPATSLEEAPLRGGMSAGPTLVREGDYFGQYVNMAARLTDIARPWSFLADEALVTRLTGSGFRAKRTRPTRIRGFGLRRPLAVMAPAPEPEASTAIEVDVDEVPAAGAPQDV